MPIIVGPGNRIIRLPYGNEDEGLLPAPTLPTPRRAGHAVGAAVRGTGVEMGRALGRTAGDIGTGIRRLVSPFAAAGAGLLGGLLGEDLMAAPPETTKPNATPSPAATTQPAQPVELRGPDAGAGPPSGRPKDRQPFSTTSRTEGGLQEPGPATASSAGGGRTPRVYTNADLDRVRAEGPSRGGFVQATAGPAVDEANLEEAARGLAATQLKARTADPLGMGMYRERLQIESDARNAPLIKQRQAAEKLRAEFRADVAAARASGRPDVDALIESMTQQHLLDLAALGLRDIYDPRVAAMGGL